MVKTNTIFAVILVAVLIYMWQQPASSPTQDTTNNVDISNLIDATVTFTGKNMFEAGTSLKTENVRILKLNGDDKNLGHKSLDSGTLTVTPGENYKFYFFMNDTAPSSNYYVNLIDYVGKPQENDDVVGEGCAIDSSLTFTSYNSGYQTQSGSTNAQSVTTSEDITVSIRVASSMDTCYGMPDASKENAVCFTYNTAAFSKVETTTNSVSTPSSLANLSSIGIACYEMPKLKDGSVAEMNIHLLSGSTEPTTEHNISVYAEDVNLDLDANTLDEILGYNDEDGNNLGSPLQKLGEIKIQ